jgi:hypothetical protein
MQNIQPAVRLANINLKDEIGNCKLPMETPKVQDVGLP